MDDLSIRRPDLRDVLRLGTVRWWEAEKGYGRITAEDREILFVSFSSLAEPSAFQELQEDQRVCFVWRGSVVDHGRHVADEVRVIGETQPTRDDQTDSGLFVEGGVRIEVMPPTD